MHDMSSENGDWAEDDELSFDEAMSNFESLSPTLSVGPPLAAHAVLVHAVPTFSVGTTDRMNSGVGAWPQFQFSQHAPV